ncbi:hypothetical protein B7C62_15930 [Kitasatospora albolonga]|uniref:DUF4386 domain-containing protein n=1 Tax=Kitasatospora albolonga TaxID=68173 RepID=A0ABC8BT54_9ACTN|nr:hypothetical protein B7C62_15930 [Kitasatospora albolonga]
MPDPLTAERDPRTLRWAAIALAAAGVLLALYPALRPYSDETTLDGADAMASGRWALSHLAGMLAFILMPLGLIGVRAAVTGTPGRRPMTAAFLTAWFGAGLALPYYGGEVFGLQAISEEAARTGDAELLTLADSVRMDAAPAAVFGIAMLLFAATGVLVALALTRSGLAARWLGWPFGAALVLYLPQFFGGPPVRIAHGVLTAVGFLLLARWLLTRTPDAGTERQAPPA